MISTQRGDSSLSLLLSLALLFGGLYFVVSDYFPAQADDLQEVVSLASHSPEARAELTAALATTPNPNRKELRRIQYLINEIVVTETARSVTGDASIKSPAAMEADQKADFAARVAAISAKGWGEMTVDEKYDFLYSKLPIIIPTLGILAAALLGFFVIFQPFKK